MGTDDFSAQLAAAAKLSYINGRAEAMNEILRWATENKEALVRADLVESLLKVCSK